MIKEERKKIEEELVKRANAMKRLMNHDGWKYFEKFLRERIEASRDIMRITDFKKTELEFARECVKNKIKVQMFVNILKLPSQWIKEAERKIKKPKEEKDG
jgi:hypothetical protein